MNKNSKFKIHRDSEIWDYEGKIEFTKELIDFFEEERKKSERERKSDKRHIAYENLDNASVYSLVLNKPVSVSEQVETDVLLEEVHSILNQLTEVEKRRFILNKMVGLKLVEIAKLEDVSETAVRKTVNRVQKKINEKINNYEKIKKLL